MLFETSLTSTPVFGLRRDMNRLFDDVLARTAPSNAWSPAVDVSEDNNEITVTAELPGVNPDNVEITCDAGVLTVRGQKSMERKEGQEGQYHLVERTFGSFSRSFRLPKGVDESKISATFDQGVLQVHVPKAALPQPKKITIESRRSEGEGKQQIHGQSSAKASGSATSASSKSGNGHNAERQGSEHESNRKESHRPGAAQGSAAKGQGQES